MCERWPSEERGEEVSSSDINEEDEVEGLNLEVSDDDDAEE